MNRVAGGRMRHRTEGRAGLGMLVLTNGVLALFCVHTSEAKVVLVTLALGGVLMELLTWRLGFTRLLGLGHILWFGLVPWLVTRIALHESGPMVFWLAAVIVINSLSLVLDVRDVFRYVGGAREES